MFRDHRYTICHGLCKWLITLEHGATSASIIVTSQTASYTVTCSDAKGQLIAVSNVLAIVAPTLIITALPAQTVTVGTSVALSLAGCESGTATWSTLPTDTGHSIVVVNPALGNNPYSVTCMSAGGCFSTAQFILVANAAAQPQLVLAKQVNKSRALLVR